MSEHPRNTAPDAAGGAVSDEHPTDGTEPHAEIETPQNDAQDSSSSGGGNEDGGDQETASEAAKYRRRLRDTEQERDRLAAHLETLQRAEVERIAADDGNLAKPSGLWAHVASVTDLVDDDGNIDPNKVVAACDEAVDTLGLARNLHRGLYVPTEGRTPDTPPQSANRRQVDVVMGRNP